MGKTEQTVGQETVGNWADSGTGNSRDGNKISYRKMIDGKNKQLRTGRVGSERSASKNYMASNFRILTFPSDHIFRSRLHQP